MHTKRTQRIQLQNTTVLAKCIIRIVVFTNKFQKSFFDS